ncbi:MAG: HAD family hydrolase [Bacteroidota bacterium]|nr:phosphoserine phosphatase [Odoribacter sp.]MDP3642482.1 HAD family hydrolase [Bacteroidota bacterium]
MAKKLIRVAIAYDFDGTLAPGNMQEHAFLPSLGIDPKSFWGKTKKKAKENDMDEILAYMQLTLDEARTKNFPIRRSDFMQYGRGIEFFEGVETYFDRINLYAKEKGITIEHYIISSGLREFVKGTKIAKHFKNIFASGFEYDANGVAVWPALAINYTNKTQYLFRINKGINNSYDNYEINKFMPEKERYIPFGQMIYIGDGETDVPAMKMIKYQGGKAIAVYNPKIRAKKNRKSPKQICEDLINQNRADYIAPANYSDGSELDKMIKLIIDKIHLEIELKKYIK